METINERFRALDKSGIYCCIRAKMLVCPSDHSETKVNMNDLHFWSSVTLHSTQW